jgi:hypothetical protein
MTNDAELSRPPRIIKAHCPTCNAERNCESHGTVYKPWSWEHPSGRFSMNGGTDHSLLECRGCETVFYLSDAWDSESVDYDYGPDGELQQEAIRIKQTFPSPNGQTRPAWFEALAKIDRQLQDILHEMYVAYENGAYILTTVGLRTALDRATEVLGIDPPISFEEKLSELEKGGWIGATEREILDVITNAGNAAAHRGWSPSKVDAGKLITAIEAFLHRAFIVGLDALLIKENIPVRPKRKPKTGSRI